MFGALGVGLCYLLARSLTRSRMTAIVAAVLLPLSGLWFAQSRIGTTDVFLAVFTSATLLALHRFLVSPPTASASPCSGSGYPWASPSR